MKRFKFFYALLVMLMSAYATNAQTATNYAPNWDNAEGLELVCDSKGEQFFVYVGLDESAAIDPAIGIVYVNLATGSVATPTPPFGNCGPNYQTLLTTGNHSYLEDGASFTIPAGVLSYSVTTISGQVVLTSPSSGPHDLPVTATVSETDPRNGDGNSYVTSAIATVDATNGKALISYILP